MKNKVIADAGSTKVEWLLLSEAGAVLSRVTSDGLNALLADSAEVVRHFTEARAGLGQSESVSEIHYYGAGCATPAANAKIHTAIESVWTAGVVHVSSDLVGAARSLLGRNRGIACILGTGSNSCLYDGSDIESNVPSLGYILGDEGSGAALGKRLVADVFKGQLPESVRRKFSEIYHIGIPEVLEKVYRTPAPNKYLASLVPFLSSHLWNPYIYNLVLEEFTRFITRNIAMYPGAHSLPICFTGSIAYYFQKVLSDAMERQGYEVAKISRTPMEGLITFHSGC